MQCFIAYRSFPKANAKVRTFMKLASVHHVFFQENRIFLAFSILSDNSFLFTLLFDVKFETSEQEMGQSYFVNFQAFFLVAQACGRRKKR